MQADRQPSLLTGPGMYREPPPPPSRDSIFGDTYGGVPNPNVMLQHGYPTRYHGPVFTFPVPGHQYAPNPYAKAPFAGMGAMNILGYQARSVTGNELLDAVLGGAVGYFLAPREDQRVIYAAAGAGGVGLLGTLGLVLLVGGEMYMRMRAQKAPVPA